MVDLRKGVTPTELADLVDLSERPRAGGWSLRAALTRYAQPQPVRVSRLLDLVRRIEFALADRTELLRSDGAALWAAVIADETADDTADETADGSAEPGTTVGLLRAAAEIDRVGDLLATWAVAREGERPDEPVDAVIEEVTGRLVALGVPEQERPGPPTGRARGRARS